MRNILLSMRSSRLGPYPLERIILFIGTLIVLLALYLTYILNANHLVGERFHFSQYIYDDEASVSRLQIPWWTLDIHDGGSFSFNTSDARQAYTSKQGRTWVIEVFGHEINSEDTGYFVIDGKRYDLDQSDYPTLQRAITNVPPESDGQRLHVTYHAGTPGGMFRVWGNFDRVARAKHSWAQFSVTQPGGAQAKPEDLKPVPIRGDGWNVDPDPHRIENGEATWRHYSEQNEAKIWAREGHVDRLYLYKSSIILSCFYLGLALIGGALIWKARRFAFHHPKAASFLAGLFVVSLVIRWDVLLTVMMDRSFGFLGVPIINGVWYDGGSYFRTALYVFFSQTPEQYTWPVGLPTFSALVWTLTGVDTLPVKWAFLLLNSFMGLVLYWGTYRLTGRVWFSFLPMIVWAIMIRPLRYEYYFMTESLAIFVFGVLVVVALSMGQRRTDWMDLIWLGALFGSAVYIRDIIFIFSPLALYLVFRFFGQNWIQKAVHVVVFTAIVAGTWSITPIMHTNKGVEPSLVSYVPIFDAHIKKNNKRMGLEEEAQGAGIIETVVLRTGRRMITEPHMVAWDVIHGTYRFWVIMWDRLTTSSVFGKDAIFTHPWFIVGELAMTLLGAAIFAAMPVALFKHREYRWLTLTLIGVTLFHIFLFPNFTARPKAPYFPMYVLCGSLAVWLLLRRFAPLWRTKPVIGTVVSWIEDLDSKSPKPGPFSA